MTDRLLAGSGSDAYTPQDWITGDKQIITGSITLDGGQGVLAAKTVIGEVTATGLGLKSLAAAVDGSQTPKMILVHEVDTTDGDIDAPVYLEGCFNPDLLVIGTGHTVATVKAALINRNIYLKAPG